jgi:imidazolonepropionase
MGLTLDEALVGVTINAAASLNRDHRVGSLEVGKQLDAVLVDGTLADLVRVGALMLKAVIKGGVTFS